MCRMESHRIQRRTISVRSRSGWSRRSAHRPNWPRSATRAASIVTCQCSARSESSFRENSIWHGCGSKSCRRSCSCTARSGVDGRRRAEPPESTEKISGHRKTQTVSATEKHSTTQTELRPQKNTAKHRQCSATEKHRRTQSNTHSGTEEQRRTQAGDRTDTGRKRQMAKRMIVMVILMTVFIAGLGFIKFKQFQAMAEQFAAMQPPPDAVTTIVAAKEEWPNTLNAIGTVA